MPLPGAATLRAQARNASQLVDWLTDGGDNQRTGWAKNEKILTKQNVGNLKLLWTLETGNQPRALHSLMPVLVIGQLATADGTRQVGIVNGISDNLYALRRRDRQDPLAEALDLRAAGRTRRRRRAATPRRIRARLGFLQPGGSSDTPVIGPADAQGRRPVYFVTGDGMLHIVNAATGEDLEPPYMFHTGKGWSLTLEGRTLWMANTYAGISVAAVNLDDPQHKVMTFNAGSGGAWGRRGVTLDSTGTAWTTTGDGVYDPTSDPPRYANSVVGVHLVERRDEAQGLLHAAELGLAAQARPRSEQHAGDVRLQGPRADCRVGQGVPGLLLDPEVGRRRRSPDAALQDAALLQRGSGLPGHGQLGRALDVGRSRTARAGCWRRSGGRSTRSTRRRS